MSSSSSVRRPRRHEEGRTSDDADSRRHSRHYRRSQSPLSHSRDGRSYNHRTSHRHTHRESSRERSRSPQLAGRSNHTSSDKYRRRDRRGHRHDSGGRGEDGRGEERDDLSSRNGSRRRGDIDSSRHVEHHRKSSHCPRERDRERGRLHRDREHGTSRRHDGDERTRKSSRSRERSSCSRRRRDSSSVSSYSTSSSSESERGDRAHSTAKRRRSSDKSAGVEEKKDRAETPEKTRNTGRGCGSSSPEVKKSRLERLKESLKTKDASSNEPSVSFPRRPRSPLSVGAGGPVAASQRTSSPSLGEKKSPRNKESKDKEKREKGVTDEAPVVKASRLERFKALRQMQQISGRSLSISAAAGESSTPALPSNGGTSSPVAASKSRSPPPSGKVTETTQGPGFLLSTGGSESRDVKQPQSRRLGGSSGNAPQEAARAAAQAMAMLAAQAARQARVGKAVDAEKPVESEAPTRTSETTEEGGSAVKTGGSPRVKHEEVQGRPEDQAVAATELKEAGDQQGKNKEQKMSKAKAKKHQQLLLLRTLEHKTAATQSKTDDPLDAFMTALESEAKEELDAAKEEERGHVAELRCLSSDKKKKKPEKQAATPAPPKIISLDEIARWEELEDQFLPVSADAKKKSEAASTSAVKSVGGEGSKNTEASSGGAKEKKGVVKTETLNSLGGEQGSSSQSNEQAGPPCKPSSVEEQSSAPSMLGDDASRRRRDAPSASTVSSNDVAVGEHEKDPESFSLLSRVKTEAAEADARHTSHETEDGGNRQAGGDMQNSKAVETKKERWKGTQEGESSSVVSILPEDKESGKTTAATAGGSGEGEQGKSEGEKENGEDDYYRLFMEEMKRKKQEAEKAAEAERQSRETIMSILGKKKGRGGGDGEEGGLSAVSDEEGKDKKKKRKKKKDRGEEEDERVFSGDDDGDESSSSDEDDAEDGKEGKGGSGEGDEENLSYFDLLLKVGAKKQLPTVDHEATEYPPIKKNLYVQVRELTQMKDHEVDALRKTHGNIRVRGKQCPRPVRTFFQCGLPDKITKYLTLRGITEPFPIQMQAIPCLMCGRDVIAVAETGSGKTLAYALPLVRHVVSVKQQYKAYLANKKLQAAEGEGGGEREGGATGASMNKKDEVKTSKDGNKEKVVVYKDFKDGAIGLVIAPTRELTNQIFKEINRCCKLVDLTAVACYGGAGIGSQLGAIKRGVDVMVGTPGRLIDILTMNGGRVTSLKRVTFIVLDEADRMFDFGFEPQVTAIIGSTRPDRQTCLFSATFPPHIEALARRILQKPLEIIVGEKGRTAATVQQYVEVMEEERKFFRLLQLLGEWQEYGSIIIFVNRQVEADELFTELLKYGYQAATLHGGQDQTDREFTIQEFQDGIQTLLIATSVAARGLDCKHCVLVINMTCPNHIEDYVHRIGRTGRAGRIGVAYTFLTKDDADKADDLEKALIQSGQTVPQELADLSAQYKQECNLGLHGKKKKGGGGFGGRGFTFSSAEKSRQQQERQQAKKDLGIEKDEGEEDFMDADMAPDDVFGPASSSSLSHDASTALDPVTGLPANLFSTLSNKAQASRPTDLNDPTSVQSAVAAAAAKAALLAQKSVAQAGGAKSGVGTSEGAERARVVAELLRRQDEEKLRMAVPPPPPGAPPPSGAGAEKTGLSIQQQAERMAQNAVQHIGDPIERARHFAAVKHSFTNYLTASQSAATSAAAAAASTSLLGLTPGQQQQQLAVAAAAATAAAAAAGGGSGGEVAEAATHALELLKSGSQSLQASMALHANLEKLKNMASQTAQSVAEALAVLSPSNATLGKIRGLSERGYRCPNTGNFVDELEINDYPQIARYKFTQRDVLNRLMEETGAVLYVKGQHVDPKEKHRIKLAPGAKYLHVEIIAPTPIVVQRARNECRQLLEALAVRSLNTSNTQTARAITGRYNIWG